MKRKKSDTVLYIQNNFNYMHMCAHTHIPKEIREGSYQMLTTLISGFEILNDLYLILYNYF